MAAWRYSLRIRQEGKSAFRQSAAAGWLKLSENGKKAAYLDTDANTGDTILVEIELGKEKAETVATNVQSFGYNRQYPDLLL